MSPPSAPRCTARPPRPSLPCSLVHGPCSGVRSSLLDTCFLVGASIFTNYDHVWYSYTVVHLRLSPLCEIVPLITMTSELWHTYTHPHLVTLEAAPTATRLPTVP